MPVLQPWVYWEGPRPGYIDLCEKAIRKVYPDVRVLTREDCFAMPGFRAAWEGSRMRHERQPYMPSHSGDFVRAYLLSQFGGIWLDADFVPLKDLRELIDTSSAFTFYESRSTGKWELSAGLCATPLGSDVAAKYFELVCRRFEDARPMEWLDVGASIFERLRTDSFQALPRSAIWEWTNPLWTACDDYAGDLTEIPDDCRGIMLWNKKLKPIAGNDSAEDIFRSETRLGALFRKVLS